MGWVVAIMLTWLGAYVIMAVSDWISDYREIKASRRG